MFGNKSSGEWTDEEVEQYLSQLSDASFQNRSPVVVYHALISLAGLVGNTLVLLVYGTRFKPRVQPEARPVSSRTDGGGRRLKSRVSRVSRTSTVHKGIRRMRSRTTLMMAVLTLFYIVNWLPHLIIRYIRSDAVNWCDNFTDCGHNTYGIVIRSVYLNSAVNAFVYSFCNGRFRQECRAFFHGIVNQLRRNNNFGK